MYCISNVLTLWAVPLCESRVTLALVVNAISMSMTTLLPLTTRRLVLCKIQGKKYIIIFSNQIAPYRAVNSKITLIMALWNNGRNDGWKMWAILNDNKYITTWLVGPFLGAYNMGTRFSGFLGSLMPFCTSCLWTLYTDSIEVKFVDHMCSNA